MTATGMIKALAIRYNEMKASIKESIATGNDRSKSEAIKELFGFREAAQILGVEKEMLDTAEELRKCKPIESTMKIVGKRYRTTLDIDVAIEKELGVSVVKYSITESQNYSSYIFTLADDRTVEVLTKHIPRYMGEEVNSVWIN